MSFVLLAELTLWDEDYDADDQIGEAVCLSLKNIRLGIPEPRTLKFGEASSYHIQLLSLYKNPEFMDSHCTLLISPETAHLKKRIKTRPILDNSVFQVWLVIRLQTGCNFIIILVCLVYFRIAIISLDFRF